MWDRQLNKSLNILRIYYSTLIQIEPIDLMVAVLADKQKFFDLAIEKIENYSWF